MTIWKKLITFAAAALITGFVGPVANADNPAEVFPNAAEISAFTGQPPAATAFINGKAAGYILSTADVIGSTGYGGEIIDVRVGVSTEGIITGAVLRHHNEPILVIGISDQDLQRFVSGLKGFNVLAPASTDIAGGNAMPDAIAGATISSAVIQDAVVRAARSVLRARAPAASGPTLKREPYTKASWQSLLADGSVQHLELDFTEVTEMVPDQAGRQGLFIGKSVV